MFLRILPNLLSWSRLKEFAKIGSFEGALLLVRL